jgi:hypothetical protein
MVKYQMQDIVIKRTKRSKDFKIFQAPPPPPQKPHKRKRGAAKKIPVGKIIFGILILLLVVISSAKILNIFSRAIIKIKLHQETLAIDTILKATRGYKNDLSFETMEIEITKQDTRPATDMKTVEQKASGQIVVYNAFGSEPQTLIKRTRFETPDGKIYRIDRQIVIPGARVENEKLVPGSLEVTVYADQPGEEYNIGLTDFTIPGFKGGPRYEKFYARSKTPMTGGFKGELPVISEVDEKALSQTLEESIKRELLTKAQLQTPEGFLLYEGGSTITFSQNAPEKKASTFTLQETGKLYAYLLPREELSNTLVKKYLGQDFKGKVEVGNLEDFEFELIKEDPQSKTLLFKLKGAAKFIWLIEEEQLKEALIASSENLEKVFENYPAIEQASVVFRPSWWRFFPKQASRINIERVTP